MNCMHACCLHDVEEDNVMVKFVQVPCNGGRGLN